VVRVIEYCLEGAADAEPIYRLVTSILDHEQAPAQELAALYHERCSTHARLATIFLRVRTDTSWCPHRSMRMHGHLRGSDNEAGIVRGSLGLRCLFTAVSFAVHARSNGVFVEGHAAD
jgi:hypothetical protein